MAEDKEMVAEEPKSSNMPMILVAVLTLVIGAVGGLFASDFMSDDTKLKVQQRVRQTPSFLKLTVRSL